MKKMRLKLKYLCSIICLLFVLNFFGVFTHFFEADLQTLAKFNESVFRSINQLKSGQTPDVPPINQFNYTFLINPREKCTNHGSAETQKLVLIIKSAVQNFNRRLAIRQTWGYEARFSDVKIKTVFILGNSGSHDLQTQVNEENNKFKDIVQADFTDTYFNNTIKTMMGFKWAVNFCKTSRFYVFADDDYYISIKNVLRFVKNPVNYPEYLAHKEDADEQLRKLARRRLFFQENGNKTGNFERDNSTEPHNEIRQKRYSLDMELPPDVKLYTGFVFNSTPHRHKSSKFYVTLSEYPYAQWPSYVTAGCYIVSRSTLLDIYDAAQYVKLFRFDDIFLGLVAYKANIDLLHSNEFHFYKSSLKSHNYKYIIASHGFDDPLELHRVWNSNKMAGYA